MRSDRFVVCLALAVLCASFHAAAAEQAFLEAARDNTLFEDTSSYRSNGIGDGLFSGLTVNDELRRALIAFDIATAVPAGSQITDVQLQLNMSQQRNGPHTSALHRVTSDWGEGNSNSTERGGGMGAPAAPNDATWAHTFYDTAQWTTVGGDFVAQSSASVAINGDGLVTWGSTAQMVADVQLWLDTPDSNFGWIVLTDEQTPGSAKRFDSREHLGLNTQPLLVVTYVGTAVDSDTWSAIKGLFR